MVPKFSIIILNYNGLEDLRNCLPSVMALDDPHHDVLVVDNGSTDDSCHFIRTCYPQVQIVRAKRNLGFAGGNNVGLKEAFRGGASYVALLNNDTRVEPSWLTGFREAFALDPVIGICGAKILDWEGTLVEFDGTIFYPANASGGYLDQPVESYQNSDKIREIAYACGGSMAISATCYGAIGDFDPSFYFYNEDIDLSLRAWISGFRVVINPRSVTYHRRGASVRRFHHSDFRDYYGLRNALTTALKNYELATFRCIYRDLIRIYLLSGKWLRLKGALFNLFILPRTFRKRRKVQRLRLRSDHDIFVRSSRPLPGAEE
ncbi:glycosyltransferase family 2 protein [candidate division CSSED10-310 bacterium]|uniref:Glycosyltransferase family 2 protein n=1 Tax=candidate division CSSED10-310 bacterium TaxID=2855610 RepID=A0ABV6YST6_UNCC1